MRKEDGGGGGAGEAPKCPLTPGEGVPKAGYLVHTRATYSVRRDPSHIYVLGTQSPDWPNGPTDSAPRGRWRDLQGGKGATPYIYFVKNNNNNKFV